MNQPLKILFKYPSRGRRERFIQGMDSIVNHLRDKENYQILVSADFDDQEMKFDILYPNTSIHYGESFSKVEAINRDIELADDWDIIVVMSDDMRFSFFGFDDVIRAEFNDGNLDKLLHIPDQDAKEHLATVYIAGKIYYDRFGFVYNPEYKSLFCDNEVQDIAKAIGKYVYVNCPGLVMHLNPAYGHLPADDLFIYQQKIGWTEDQETYNKRKAKNFDL
jgi:hypothetical protein